MKPLGQSLFGLRKRNIADKQSIQIAPPEFILNIPGAPKAVSLIL
jgi:hypothetical protein